MDLLKAVNSILPKLGEHPVTSVEAKSPTLAVVLPQLDETRMSLLITGWWFNEYPVTLYPDSEGGITTPNDMLSFVPDGRLHLAQRGKQFFNTADRSYKFPGPVRGVLVQDVPFEELPESVAQYVLYSALVVIYATDIGFEQVVQIWSGMANAAQAAMEAEHMKQMKYTIKSSKRWTNLRRALRN